MFHTLFIFCPPKNHSLFFSIMHTFNDFFNKKLNSYQDFKKLEFSCLIIFQWPFFWKKYSSTWFNNGKDYLVNMIVNNWYMSQVLK